MSESRSWKAGEFKRTTSFFLIVIKFASVKRTISDFRRIEPTGIKFALGKLAFKKFIVPKDNILKFALNKFQIFKMILPLKIFKNDIVEFSLPGKQFLQLSGGLDFIHGGY